MAAEEHDDHDDPATQLGWLVAQQPCTVIAGADETASFRRPLQFVEAIGTGNLRALNAVTDSHINLHGGLEVHGRIASTGVVMVRDLRCTGTLHAGRLAILGGIEILRS